MISDSSETRGCAGRRSTVHAVCALAFLLTGCGLTSADETRLASPLDPWRSGVTISPVAVDGERHTVHTYFNMSPESPDGEWVAFFSSTDPESHTGEVRIQRRSTGEEKTLARNVTVEDVHRTACQQWVSNGRRVVFHDLREGQWMVVSVDVADGRERILARDRMAGWGQPASDIVPLYSPHFAPGKFFDVELANAETGEIRPGVTAAGARAAYPQLFDLFYRDEQVSLYFPVLSPDLRRVFFKVAGKPGGDFRSKSASVRNLLIAYDLEKSRFLFGREQWGHPAWHPDSRRIINVDNVLIDSDDGSVRPIPGLPKFPGSHPSISPDGALFASDVLENGKDSLVVVGDLKGHDHVAVHRFDNSKGASSWRPSHPHPVFSADGKRLYFNVNSDKWTRLFVAEVQK